MENITAGAVNASAGSVQGQPGGQFDLNLGTPKLKTFSTPLMIAAATVLTIALAFGAYAGLCAYVSNSDTMWPGVNILGQDLSGLTIDEAANKINAVVPTLSAKIYLYQEDRSPGSHEGSNPDASIRLTDLGLKVDGHAVAQAAHDLNVNTPPFLSLGWQFLTGQGVEEYRAAITLDPELKEQRAQETAEALSYPITETVFAADDTTLTVTNPIDGRSVDPANIRKKLDLVVDDLSNLSFDVPYSVVPAGVANAEAVHEAVYMAPKNAWYDRSWGGVSPGEYGSDFNVESLQAQLDATPQGQTVTLALTKTAPAITMAQMNEVLFRDVLGEASTPLTGGSVRINNVKLAAKAINGFVLNAGEVFSYNGTTGQRTRAKGYGEAPAYVNGMTVNEVGGGVCQPSSTLYYACLRSNMEITERAAHRYIPSYIDPGMDATVSWGGPDYKFTNNTDYPVKISAYTSNGRLYVKLIGTNVTGRYVKMTYKLISTTGYSTRYRKDPSLPNGTVYSTPYTGYRYKTYRNVYSADGTLISSEFEATSDYKARDRIIIQN